MAMAMRIAMISTTTISSISVKPPSRSPWSRRRKVCSTCDSSFAKPS